MMIENYFRGSEFPSQLEARFEYSEDQTKKNYLPTNWTTEKQIIS